MLLQWETVWNVDGALVELGQPGLPECRCGKRMTVFNTISVPEPIDAHIRVYKCASCQHEMRLTVWSADALN